MRLVPSGVGIAGDPPDMKPYRASIAALELSYATVACDTADMPKAAETSLDAGGCTFRTTWGSMLWLMNRVSLWMMGILGNKEWGVPRKKKGEPSG